MLKSIYLAISCCLKHITYPWALFQQQIKFVVISPDGIIILTTMLQKIHQWRLLSDEEPISKLSVDSPIVPTSQVWQTSKTTKDKKNSRNTKNNSVY